MLLPQRLQVQPSSAMCYRAEQHVSIIAGIVCIQSLHVSCESFSYNYTSALAAKVHSSWLPHPMQLTDMPCTAVKLPEQPDASAAGPPTMMSSHLLNTQCRLAADMIESLGVQEGAKLPSTWQTKQTL